MIKPGLEKFDSPIVIINQEHEGEDWGVAVSYVSKQDVLEAEGELKLEKIGWQVSVTRPNLDDVDFDEIFGTPESALEFGIKQILSGRLTFVAASEDVSQDKTHPFGHYQSIV